MAELGAWLTDDEHAQKMKEIENNEEDIKEDNNNEEDNKEEDNKEEDNDDDCLIDLMEVGDVEVRLDASAVLSAPSDVQEYLLKRMKYVYGMS